MERLDPLIDVVFEQLLTRDPALLIDMLEGVLERSIAEVTRLDPDELDEPLLGSEHRIEARVTFTSGSTLVVRMHLPHTRAEAEVLAYSSTPLEPEPTTVVGWLREPLIPTSGRLRTVFEWTERTTNTSFGDKFAIYVIQLRDLSPSGATGHDGQLERWARFLVARSQVLLDELAAEDPIMATALRTLDELSADPELRRRAEQRAAEIASAR